MVSTSPPRRGPSPLAAGVIRLGGPMSIAKSGKRARSAPISRSTCARRRGADEFRFEIVSKRAGMTDEFLLRNHGDISVGPYVRNWGSLRRACIQFGRYKRGEISMKELLRGGDSGTRAPLSPGVRWDVFERDGHRCRVCGRNAAEHGVVLEV